ncbi:MAG: CBS domain-containing protein [Bryobacteraceae bacterium]|nr:CBS domain-containing protein [Bryobacteraceae bacterium]
MTTAVAGKTIACQEVMTKNPVFCLPSEMVAHAAELMKKENVGALPVVHDRKERVVIGILTDRDVALRVDAMGKDSRQTTVEQVMSRNPVTCKPGEDCEKAFEMMTRQHIRRLPVVDPQGKLLGVIAQADLAKALAKPEALARLMAAAPLTRKSAVAKKAAGAGLGLLAAAGVGAGLMYFLDPKSGRGRRRRVVEKADHLAVEGRHFLEGRKTDLTNRALGLKSEIQSALHMCDEVSDEVLEARVRTRLGRVASHPKAVHVEARGGTVTMTGAVPEAEADRVVNGIRMVPGVRHVADHLVIEPRLESTLEPEPAGARPVKRVLAGLAGICLLAAGLKKP